MPEFFDIATYDYIKVQAVLDVPETYTEIARLVTPPREEGVYEIGYSITGNFNQISKSIYIRFSTDGGASWTELVSEPGDITDVKAASYMFPKEQAAGVFDFRFEARKEDVVGTLNIDFLDLWYKRLGKLTN